MHGMAGRNGRLLLLFMILALFIAACSAPDLGGTDVPGPPPEENGSPNGDGDEQPGADDDGADDYESVDYDTPLTTGDGPLAPLTGNVVFADTDIGIASFISFHEDKDVPTEYGHFEVDIPQGENEYIVETLLGGIRQSFTHDGSRAATIVFPKFTGWSKDFFDELLTVAGEHGGRRTMRWPRDTTIQVWIEDDHPNVSQAAIDNVWAVFEEWEDILDQVITFERVWSKANAENGIIVMFADQPTIAEESKSDANAIGYCEVGFNESTGSAGAREWQFEIVHGKIMLAYEHQTSSALVRHELGHCIGLAHSSNDRDVMHFALDSQNPDKSFSQHEKQMARLLYSIPRATRAFGGSVSAQRVVEQITSESDNGTVTIIRPSRAH